MQLHCKKEGDGELWEHACIIAELVTHAVTSSLQSYSILFSNNSDIRISVRNSKKFAQDVFFLKVPAQGMTYNDSYSTWASHNNPMSVG